MAFGRANWIGVTAVSYAGWFQMGREGNDCRRCSSFLSSNIKDQVGPREAGTSPGSAC
jgi:hypothetical protein